MLQIFAVSGMWIAEVTILSAILAVVEIVLERGQGWATALGNDGLGIRLLAGSPLASWIDKPYITAYHLLVFGAVLPTVLLAQSRVAALTGLGVPATPMGNFLFYFSAFLAICIVEDFLWFALNWYYPTSLTDLFDGKIWWHTGWVALGPSLKLPRCYFSVGGVALCLFVLRLALAG
ncbi:MAG TPA: hypothetical protein VHX60_12800 [Acidobacteriaceae bacterium]|jgi:hypothetical protein|nr:hypothetical protein [Acidobacteriaceae bacterium]